MGEKLLFYFCFFFSLCFPREITTSPIFCGKTDEPSIVEIGFFIVPLLRYFLSDIPFFFVSGI